MTVALDRDKYKEELRQQILEKKNRDLRDKQQRVDEELREEARVRRERDELLRYFNENRSEQAKGSQEGSQNGEALPFNANKGSVNMQTNMISNVVNPRQVAQDMAINLPSTPHAVLQPPTKEEVDL